jgi:hypothetical protein
LIFWIRSAIEGFVRESVDPQARRCRRRSVSGLRSSTWKVSTYTPTCASRRAIAQRERLLRYGLRPPFAYDQVRLTPEGRIAFALRKARKNGDTHRFYTPLQLLRRLAWLIVPPRQALVRYEGVLAPHAHWRSLVVPPPASADDKVLVSLPDRDPPRNAFSRAAATRWASLLRRVYGVDALLCPKPGCGGRMRVVGAITSPPVIRRILDHLGLPTELPAFAPARGPPLAAFSNTD